jgi:hypothetical protein
VQSIESQLTFRRNMSPQSSGLTGKLNKKALCHCILTLSLEEFSQTLDPVLDCFQSNAEMMMKYKV